MMLRISRTIYVLVLLLGPFMAPAQTSTELIPGPSINPAWRLSLQNQFVYEKSQQEWGSTTRFQLLYDSPVLKTGIVAQFNQLPRFTFSKGRFRYVYENRTYFFYDSTLFSSHPDEYKLENPFSAFAQYQYKKITFSGSLSLLNQSVAVDTPRALEVEGDYFYLHWNRQEQAIRHLLAKGMIGYEFSKLFLGAGAMNLPIYKNSHKDTYYMFEPEMQPFLTSSCHYNHSQIHCFLSNTTASLRYIHDWRMPFSNKNRILGTHFIFKNCYREYPFRMFQCIVRLPVFKYIETELRYQDVWVERDIQSREDFKKWQNSILVDEAFFQIDHTYPNRSLFLNFTFVLQQSSPKWPLQVISTNLYQNHFFLMKQRDYLDRPVGYIELYNESNTPISMELWITSTSGTVVYRSPSITISPQTKRMESIYLVLKDEHIHRFVSKEHLMVSAIIDGQSKMVDYRPILIFDRHGWSGQVKELSEYILSLDSQTELRFQSLYQNLPKVSDAPKEQLSALETYITQVGSNLMYLTDPITDQEFSVDYVRFPDETYKNGGGDCEDLTVYLGASLRTVGYDVALVDVKQIGSSSRNEFSSRKNGHVFLLVDTGMPVQECSSLDLNELQYVSRINREGLRTIWLPIESTRISNGFKIAFQYGVQLYHQIVIEDEGVSKGWVQVYDF